jgi:hypothetical protein
MEEHSYQLTLMLGRLEGKLDAALQRLDAQDNRHDHLDERVSSLETRKAQEQGIVIAISVVFSCLFSVGLAVVGKFL